MDPISAFSFAVNVITLLDITVKTGKTLHDLYNSTSGFNKETEELSQATSRLKSALDSLDAAQGQLVTAPSTAIDNSTAMAAKWCGETVQTIQRILEECRVKHKSSARGAVKSLFRSSKHRPKLVELQETLEQATNQLRTSLAIATRTDVAGIRQLLDISDVKQAQLATKLQTIIDELHKLDENRRLLEIIKEAFTLSNDSLNAMNHIAILRALRPSTAGKRFEEINDPVANTFAWILEEPDHPGDAQSETPSVLENSRESQVSSEFKEWLEAGSGIFHVAGKPGCGKSTLMKYLASHHRSRNLLQQWANKEGKQLILSSFFFWKLGTEEQKTMRGLLRGVLYEVLEGNPAAAKLVFPEHWAPKRYAVRLTTQDPGIRISEGQVEAAFDRLLNCEKIFSHFKICLFIDGLDEFDEPTESLWGFSNKLCKWTEHENVKLCVSSREETPILRALNSAQRITLHKLTRSDVEVLVRSRLESNPQFQSLAQSDPAIGSEFPKYIVRNARGVFLWVVLLLKWIEEELTIGPGSFQALQRLVKTAPRELDEFFARILESIPRHHSRGAYFILAMMLRVRGYCIGRDCSRGIGEWPDVCREPSTFGISYIFDAFDSCEPSDADRHIAFPVPPCTDKSDYHDRQLQTVSRLQSWCKGLVEVREIRGVQAAMFTHRSVPDFLSSALQDIAPKWNMDDNWIAEGIFTICLAESKSWYEINPQHRELITARLAVVTECIARSTLLPITPSTSRIFALLDAINASRQSLMHGARKGFGAVHPPRLLLGAGNYDCKLVHGNVSPTLAIATAAVVPFVEYVMWKLEDPRTLNDPLNRLLMLAAIVDATFKRHLRCKFSDISPIVKAVLASGISPNVEYPQFPQKENQIFTFEEWLEYLDSRKSDQVIKNKSPWRDTLSVFLAFIAFSDRFTVPNSIWNELEVWLQFGAEVPAEVLVITLPVGFSYGVGFRFPAERAEVARRSLYPYRNSRKASFMEYFRTFKSTTLSSMIKWHSPKNMDVLLTYTDPVSSLAVDAQEWKPPPYTSCSSDDDDYNRKMDWYSPAREHLRGIGRNWVYGLSWRSDLHEWVTEGYKE